MALLAASVPTPLAAAPAAEPVGEELPPEARAMALIALLVVVLAGLLLVFCVVILSRWIRRRVSDQDEPRRAGRRPASPGGMSNVRRTIHGRSDETLSDPPDGETRAGN